VIRFLRILLCVAVLSPLLVAQTTLNAAGATFPYPIYSKWFSEYHNAHSDVQVNYQSIGSGGGIRQVLAGTVDFGASDGPMTDEQLAQAKFKILHIPTVLGSVVPAYNVPGVSADLKFSPDVLADIFLGKITTWNDERIKKLNPGISLPSTEIVVVHRSDGSGTTYIFTDYLSKVSPEWKASVNKGTSVNWKVGMGGKGNEGVAGYIRNIQGSIGYVELIYALQNKIAYGSVRNSAGNYVKATLASTTAAAAGVQIPADYRVSITNAPGKEAYPISSFTWLLVPQQSRDPNKGRIIREFVEWMATGGQSFTTNLSYAPLPKEVTQKILVTAKSIK